MADNKKFSQRAVARPRPITEPVTVPLHLSRRGMLADGAFSQSDDDESVAVPVFEYGGLELPNLEMSVSDRALLGCSLAGENYVRLLYALALASASAVNTILEIGHGGSSVAFAHALKMIGKENSKIVSVEIDAINPIPFAVAAVEKFGVTWQIVRGDSLKVPLDQLPSEVDLLYIDGDHGGEHSIGDYRRYVSLVRAGGLIVFDDYPLFPGPAAAVATLNTEGVVGKKLTYNLQDGNSFYVIQK